MLLPYIAVTVLSRPLLSTVATTDVTLVATIIAITLGSLRWDDGYARERQAEVKYKNTGLPSVFIHPSNLGGNCKTTLVSSHRKRSLLFLYFPVGNSVCQLFTRFISRILFLYYAVHFLVSFCQKFPNRMWIQWTDWATAVCSWSWFSRQIETVQTTIMSGWNKRQISNWSSAGYLKRVQFYNWLRLHQILYQL